MLCFPAVLQVTHKLAALLIQAYQQPGTISQVPLLASFLVGFWIETAYVAITASPGSRAATSVRQQLQDSQLLQHMASCMDAAAALLTAAAAAVAAAAANSGGSTLGAAGTLQDRISFQRLGCFVNTAACCRCLLQYFHLTSCVLSDRQGAPPGMFVLPAALPAAPAAVRLIITLLQAYGRLQQQQQLQHVMDEISQSDQDWAKALPVVPRVMSALVGALKDESLHHPLQSCPGASELLLLPEFVSCLALMPVVIVLGLDTSSNNGAGAAATPSTLSGSSRSSPGRQVLGAARQQQLAQQAVSGSSSSGGSGSSSRGGAGSSGRGGASSSGGGRARAGSSSRGAAGNSGSSSSRAVSSRGSGLSSGVRMDSVTPLSCGLFDILGVTKETAVELAAFAEYDGLTTLAHLETLLEIYRTVLKHQVSQYAIMCGCVYVQYMRLSLCATHSV